MVAQQNIKPALRQLADQVAQTQTLSIQEGPVAQDTPHVLLLDEQSSRMSVSQDFKRV
eukprot:m.589788 g.589788  ORF g.589788 m.589788 type:complete len:58 (+) comp58009_c0_seq8:2636-2809(+)